MPGKIIDKCISKLGKEVICIKETIMSVLSKFTHFSAKSFLWFGSRGLPRHPFCIHRLQGRLHAADDEHSWTCCRHGRISHQAYQVQEWSHSGHHKTRLFCHFVRMEFLGPEFLQWSTSGHLPDSGCNDHQVHLAKIIQEKCHHWCWWLRCYQACHHSIPLLKKVLTLSKDNSTNTFCSI